MSELEKTRRPWTRDELKLAFYIYCQLPFGKLHASNPEVRKLAHAVGRTPGAAAMKLVNFASLDPTIIGSGRRGLGHASRLDAQIWQEFHSDWGRLAVECERQLALATGSTQAFLHPEVEASTGFLDEGIFTGETREVLTRVRIGQQFFRRSVLASFGNRCCMSDLSEQRLLVASHIKPWTVDKGNRLNPRNGLCLSSIHDKAFDAGLITLDENLCVVLSQPLLKNTERIVVDAFHSIDGKRIRRPERFVPDEHFLAYHREVRFVDSRSDT